MIMPWNRREVFAGYPTKDYYALLDKLRAGGINYDIRVENMGITGRMDRTGMGRIGEDPKYDMMYYVYVHRRDYDRAGKSTR